MMLTTSKGRGAGLVVVVGSVLLGAAGRADDGPFAKLRAEIVQAVDERVVPSVAVAVARDGTIVWEEAFGWAVREQEILATPQTMYSLASISKPITATGLMVLVERGLIELDRPINDYLGESRLTSRRGAAEEATVRRVANHTAGLPLHYQFFYIDEPYRAPPRDETIRRYGFIYTPAGEHYQYSNLGYGVLDHVIARVSGRPYVDFMRDEVFVPLGLSDMSADLPADREEAVAVRYEGDGGRLPWYDFDHPGASAVHSSVHDLVRFGMFHLKQRQPEQAAVLSDETIDTMQQATATIRGETGYGIGWTTSRHRGYATVAHSGGMPGVATMLTLVPEAGVVVALLCNAQGQFPYAMAEKVLDEALPERAAGEAEKTSSAATAGGDKQKAAGDRLSKRRADWVGHWVGEVATYEGTRRLEVWFDEQRKVRAKLGEGETAEVERVVFVDDRLQGVFDGDLQTEDAKRMPYRLQLNLALSDGLMYGAVVAASNHGRNVRALSHWAELQKDQATDGETH